MKTRWLLLVSVVLALTASHASAEEPVIPFIEGLRERGYYDTLEEYLDKIAQDPDIPAEIKKRIPFERAVTLTESAFAQKNADLQHRQLDRAAAYLETFINNNPGHPLLGEAKTRRGDIFLGKARAYILQARSPSNSGRRKELSRLAQQNIDTARKVYQSAHDEHEKRWKQLSGFTEDPERKKLRDDALSDYIRAQINLAKTTYEEAQIHSRGSAKFRELLTKASKQFEEIHKRYRSQIGGLLSRMWQGKCFEEQNEIGRALGIYGELLEHPGQSAALKSMQHQVQLFKLICLNHDKRKDYRLVESFATEWLKQNRGLQRTPVGLGIRYQLAVAREKQAISRSLPKPQRERLLNNALSDARYVNRFPGKYKDVTTMMIGRLNRALGRETGDPDTFADAFSAAQVSYGGVKPAQEALDEARAKDAPKEEIAELTAKLKTQVEETARLYQLSLKLARSGDNIDQINTARHILAYLYYLQADLFNRTDRIYEAAVLAEFVARHYKDQSPDTARNAAFLAMACYDQARVLAPRGHRQTEMRWIIRMARHIIDNWPGSKRAIDATYKLGEMYERQERPLQAARWYSKIPESAKDQYAYALLRTGQSYWGHYLTVAALEPSRQNHVKALKENAAANWAEAVADLLNPSWSRREHLERERDVARLFADPKPKQKSPPPPKKDANQKKRKRKPKPKNKDNKAKPKPKANGKKPTPNQDTDAETLAELRKQSVNELQQVLKKLTGEDPQSTEEAKLRASLIQTLQKTSRDDLKNLFAVTLEVKPDEQQPPLLEQLFDELLAKKTDAELAAILQNQVDHWRNQAAYYLKRGVDRLQAETPAATEPPGELIAGKTSLAQYLIGLGRYQQVLALLNDPPHSVVKAMEVKDETQRPGGTGIKSRSFAGLVYQLLARCYIGERNLEDFRHAMQNLEQIAEGEDKKNITAIYERIGRELQREIERLKIQKKTERLKTERENFQWIVDELFKRKDELKYNTLIWIAESSYGLGEGLGTGEAAAEYFKDAAEAYQQILQSPQIDDSQRLGVRLRLVNCKRRQGAFDKTSFPKALEIVEGILADNENLLRAQVVAALTFQDWGGSGDSEKFQTAIAGDEERNIWGWAGISRKIRQTLDYHRTTGEELSPKQRTEYREQWLQARYYMAWCRLQYGISRSADKNNPQRRKVLGNALFELKSLSMTCGVIDDLKIEDEATRRKFDARGRFNDLYETIQLAMGTDKDALETLTWPKPVKQPQPKQPIAKKPDENGGGEKSDNQIVQAPPKEKTEEGTNVFAVLFGLVVLIGGFGLAGWYFYNNLKGGRKRRPAYAAYTLGNAPALQSSAGQPTKKRTQRKPSGGQPASGKPARSAGKSGQNKSGQSKSAGKPQSRKPSRPSKPPNPESNQ